MCGAIALGVLGVIVACKLVRRHHHRHGRWGGWHHRRGWGWRYGGGSPVAWFSRELSLTRDQEKEVSKLFDRVWGSLDALRRGRWRWAGTALDAVAGDEFDRTAVEGAATEAGEALSAVERELVAALEHLHLILTPEQRARLRDLRGRHDAGGPGWGPYR